ncbi:hypothetical protein P3X46_030304 [Hevea brasiliensis]|uniref:Cytochrome P450 n=1 Tax=Hevea brasiliensis TaxID=3981 RepID=A0ABQ9KID2_HEVBR|nr:cytochrome P450 726A27-like [Hevea brasiliensis]KAJ9139580.1 hypothetical protein P3X46_030304 [Hevea brasiliensis]
MEHQILSFPVLVSFLLFILMLLRIWKKHNNDYTPPPGPWKLPFLGNLHQLAGSSLTHHRLRDLARTYGPVMGIQLGQVPAVVISSPEAAKEVLKIQEVQFADRSPVLATEKVLYNGNDIVFGLYGDQWRQMRKICTLELLSAKRVQSFKAVREEEVLNFVRFLDSKSGTPVNLTHSLFALTNTIISRTSIGKNCKNQETLLRIIDDIIGVVGGFSPADVFPSFKFLLSITGEKSRLELLHRETDQILEDIINEHRASKALSKKSDLSEADNLLDVLVNLQDCGNFQVPLTNDCIKGAILDMFIAGTDTSSKTAEWAMAELMKNPRAMKKAQEEVRHVFGKKGKVDEAGFQELKYLKLVIKETLRLHPPAPMIQRQCREKTQVNGYDINPKTKIFVHIWAIGRDPNIWTEADKFCPERFIDSTIDYKGSNFELLPFGAGKRICPGMTLGLVSLELSLAQMLYHFDWKLPDGVTPDNLDMSEGFGGAIKRGVDLKLIPIPCSPMPIQ